MNDANEPLEDKVKRLEAELTSVKTERDKYKDQFEMVAHDLARKEWEGVTEEQWDQMMRNPTSLRSLIDDWKAEDPNG
jgi:hypothetical protein